MRITTKLLNHNELRPNIWKFDTEITVIMVHYVWAMIALALFEDKGRLRGGKAQSEETLISWLLMICELQTLILAAIISRNLHDSSFVRPPK